MFLLQFHPWFVPIVLGPLDAKFVQILRHSKTLICEPGHEEFVFYGMNLNQATESALNLYVSNSSQTRMILTDINHYSTTVHYESCSLLFIEHSLHTSVSWLRSNHRKLIVTSTESFYQLNKLFIKKHIYDAVFFVLDQSQMAIHHYNRFRKQHNQWATLTNNPLIEVTRDLSSATFTAEAYNRLDWMFIDFAVTNMNATRVVSNMLMNGVGMAFTHSMFRYGESIHQIYMHRSTGIHILVPKLDQPKPLISVLVDPFDFATWLLCGLTILASAFLRVCCSQRYSLRRYLKSVQDIVAYSMVNSPMKYHRPLEQLTIGLLNLLNVVLMTAYKSLVISFLLNTRYFPELDTIQQVNDSCCWGSSAVATVLNLHVSNACRPTNSEESFCFGRFQCYLVYPNVDGGTIEVLSPSVIENYRMSQVVMQAYPVTAVAFGDVGVIERIRFYTGVFFGEAALFEFFEPSTEQADVHRSNQGKTIAVGDLSLMWIAYCCGVCLSLVTFIGELAVHLGGTRWVCRNV